VAMKILDEPGLRHPGFYRRGGIYACREPISRIRRRYPTRRFRHDGT
jgi:hypothetical protein